MDPIDRQIADRRVALAERQAPLIRLASELQRLALLPATPERRARRRMLRLWLTAAAPARLDEARRLRGEIADRMDERARLVLSGLLRQGEGRGPARRSATEPVAACASSPYQPPIEGVAVSPRTAARLGHRHGATLIGMAGAIVTAPARGGVAYAGRFRRFGRILILDHGGGWVTVLTGLASLDVEAGDAVDAGGAVGRLDPAAPLMDVELVHRGVAVDPLAIMRRCAAMTPHGPFPPAMLATTWERTR